MSPSRFRFPPSSMWIFSALSFRQIDVVSIVLTGVQCCDSAIACRFDGEWSNVYWLIITRFAFMSLNWRHKWTKSKTLKCLEVTLLIWSDQNRSKRIRNYRSKRLSIGTAVKHMHGNSNCKHHILWVAGGWRDQDGLKPTTQNGPSNICYKHRFW